MNVQIVGLALKEDVIKTAILRRRNMAITICILNWGHQRLSDTVSGRHGSDTACL